jgi:hypothetical protein
MRKSVLQVEQSITLVSLAVVLSAARITLGAVTISVHRHATKYEAAVAGVKYS